MNIIHLDVDSNLSQYLEGDKYEMPLQEYIKNHNVSEIEAVTCKLISKATKENLSKLPKLKLIITRTVGVDHIDLEYCREKNISVYHIIDYGSFNIAEHTFALLLTGTRNILECQKEIKQGVYNYAHHLGVSLKGKTLGVVGTGRIGLEVIKRAVGFEMEIIAFDVYQNEKAAKEMGFSYVTLDELAKRSDVITLHAPLMDSTRHMINDHVIQQMKDGVVLINTARGGLIKTEDVVKNIKKFRFIGLDVVEGEDTFSKDHPLLKFDNILITPHIAFYSDASVKKIGEETKRLFENYQKGESDGRVE